MNGRVVWFGCVALAAGYGCAGDHFDEECPAGTVKLGTKCVVPAPAAGGTGGKGGAAGGGGQSGTGPGGAGNAAGGSAGAAAGTAGTSAAGKGGGGGAAGTGGSSGGGGGGAGTAGASGVGGAGAAGAAGSSAAGSAGASGSAGKAGTGGAAGSGGAGAKGGAAGAAGTGGGGAGSGGAGGGGASGGGGSTAGSGGGGSSGGGGDAGASGSAGSGGTCVVSSCTADECYVPTCDGPSCSQAFADAGTTCGTNGVCNGKGVCGDCKPGDHDCNGKTPRSCGDDGKWTDGTACDIACTGAGVCSTVTALAAGNSHKCALLSDGHVRCWGDNLSGQLGVDVAPAIGTAEVQNITTATQLVAGSSFSCVRLEDASVWCWGDNSANALGQDSALMSQSAKPVEVQEAKGAKQIFANAYAEGACVTMPLGELLCWGNRVLPPAPVAGVSNVTSMGQSEDFSCARQLNGSMYCWGKNNLGQCATGSVGAPVATPTKVAISVGLVSVGRAHGCLVYSSNGETRCWGADDLEQLGNGVGDSGPKSTPWWVNVPGTSLLLSVGGYHGCAATADDVYCWGKMGSQTMASPLAIANVGKALRIASSGMEACAQTAPTTVLCWDSATSAMPVVW